MMFCVRFTASKVSKYGVISGPYFPLFVFSPNTSKYGAEITPYLNIIHAVIATSDDETTLNSSCDKTADLS